MDSSRKDTGIYVENPPEVLWSADNSGDTARVKEHARQHNLALDVNHILNGAEALANEVIEADRSGDWPWKADREATVSDARELLIDVRCVRINRQSRHPLTAAAFMFHLGRKYERLQVRSAEPLALTGRKVVQGGQRAAEQTHGTLEERQAEDKRRWQEFRKAMKETKGRKMEAYKLASKRAGCSLATMRSLVNKMQNKKC